MKPHVDSLSSPANYNAYEFIMRVKRAKKKILFSRCVYVGFKQVVLTHVHRRVVVCTILRGKISPQPEKSREQTESSVDGKMRKKRARPRIHSTTTTATATAV